MNYKNINIIADYHTHTVYSHGKGTVRDNVLRAIELGISTIAITDHGAKHIFFGISDKELAKQKEEIVALRQEFPNINILQGVEANITGVSGVIDVSPKAEELLDVVVCGFHKPVFSDKFSDYFKIYFNSYSAHICKPTSKQIVKNTDAYINAIVNNKIDIISHPNFHLKLDIREVAECCSANGTVLELSSRHDDLNTADYEAICKSNVYLAVNSDAHRVSNIGNCRAAVDAVEKYSIPHSRIINCDETGFDGFRSSKNKPIN